MIALQVSVPAGRSRKRKPAASRGSSGAIDGGDGMSECVELRVVVVEGRGSAGGQNTEVVGDARSRSEGITR
jgi:hypothetical protein